MQNINVIQMKTPVQEGHNSSWYVFEVNNSVLYCVICQNNINL